MAGVDDGRVLGVEERALAVKVAVVTAGGGQDSSRKGRHQGREESNSNLHFGGLEGFLKCFLEMLMLCLFMLGGCTESMRILVCGQEGVFYTFRFPSGQDRCCFLEMAIRGCDELDAL